MGFGAARCFMRADVLKPSVTGGDRTIRTDANRDRPSLVYRLILDIFVPSILTPAINPCWLNIKA